MAARNRLNAAAVDFREIRRIVDDECHDGRIELGIGGQIHTEQVIRREVDEEHLQHERRAAHDGNVQAYKPRKGLDAAHAAKRNQHAEGQRAQKREEENLQGDHKALTQHGEHSGNIHGNPLS